MAIADSIAGQLGSAVWRYNPMIGVGVAAGVGAGAYAGAHTFVAEDGTFQERASAAGLSAGRYAMGGLLGFGALTIAANPTFGVQRWEGRTAGSFLRSVPGRIQGAGQNVARSYQSGASELRSTIRSEALGGMEGPLTREAASATRWAGLKGGIPRVMEQQRGLMMGAGAGIGALIGSSLSPDNPGRGAVIGGAVGAGAGLAASTAIRASRVWNKFGFLGKAGAIGALTAGAFGATTILGRSKYGQVDQANPEDYGMQARMNAMSASGDIVLGLHNRR